MCVLNGRGFRALLLREKQIENIIGNSHKPNKSYQHYIFSMGVHVNM